MRQNPRFFQQVDGGREDEGGVWKLLAGGVPQEGAPEVRSLLTSAAQPSDANVVPSRVLLPANAPVAIIAPLAARDAGRTRFLPFERNRDSNK